MDVQGFVTGQLANEIYRYRFHTTNRPVGIRRKLGNHGNLQYLRHDASSSLNSASNLGIAPARW